MAEQQINSQIQTNNEELTNTITLHDIIRMVIANWYWFVLSTVCCLCAAYYYLASTPKIYSRTATILVKDSRKGGDVDLTAFSDLAGFQNRRNVDNEVFILQSRRLMTNVVKQLNLTVNYSVSERLRRRDLYGQAPIDVKFINDNDNQSLAMEITPIDDDKIRLSGFEDQFVTKHESRSVITAAYGDTIPTPVGQVVVQKSLYMAPDYIGVPIRVTKSSLGRTTNAYRAAVKSDVANKQASVVTISMNNTVPRRAEDVINTLIEAYNEDAIEDKRRVSVATGKFIKARLDVIGRELGDVDRNIEDIKKDNRMVDITSEAARSVSESSRYKTEGLSLENQINVAEYIRTYLNDPKNVGELIPAMAAAGTNTAIAKQIEDYNSAILRREKLLENSSERSPVIQDLDNLLAAVRRSIISSLDSNISTLEIQRDAMRKEETQANIRISTMPSQEKVILGITRQQKIKEELFLYLLNKQEENQLNYAVAESNSRSIDYAYGSNAPVSPRPMMILGIALIVGLAIPFGLLYLIGMLDTTIRGRKDIEDNVNAPFLGDIPYHEGGGKAGIVVRETGRDALSEAFRILRSNMTFMSVSAGTDIRTILFTSSDPARRQDLRGDEPGHDPRHGRQARAADRPRPAPPCPVVPAGPQQQQNRHHELSRRNGLRCGEHDPELRIPPESRRDLRRSAAAQPGGDAPFGQTRQAHRRNARQIRLCLPRQYARHVGGRRNYHRPACGPLYIHRTRGRARPAPAARHRAALPREEAPQHVHRSEQHPRPPSRIWIRVWLRLRLWIRIWLRRRLQGSKLPQTHQALLPVAGT